MLNAGGIEQHSGDDRNTDSDDSPQRYASHTWGKVGRVPRGRFDGWLNREFRELEDRDVTPLRQRDDDRCRRRLGVVLSQLVSKAARIDADDRVETRVEVDVAAVESCARTCSLMPSPRPASVSSTT